MRDPERTLLSLSTILLTIISIELVVAGRASEYELTIYSGYSHVFWFALVGSILTAGIVLFLSAKSGSRYWIHSIALLIMAYTIFLTLPAIRGYVLFGRGTGDVLVHVAQAEEIWSTGQIGEKNWYPIIHILLGLFHTLGLEYVVATSILSILHTSLLVVGIGLLIRTTTYSRYRFLLAFSLSTPLLFGVFHRSTSPAAYSFMLLPIMLYTIHRAHQSVSHTVLATVFTLTIVFYHPITTGLFIAMLIVTVISRNVQLHQIAPVIGFGTFSGVYWYLGFKRIGDALLLLGFFSETTEESSGTPSSSGAANEATNEVTSGALQVPELAARFIELYGAVFLYFTVAGICVIVVGYWYAQRNEISPIKLEMCLQYLAGGAIGVSFLLYGLIVDNPLRVAHYLILASILVITVVVPYPSRRKINRLTTIGVLLILFVSVPLSIGMVYPPHKHLTVQETSGTEWHIEYHNDDRISKTYMTSPKMDWYVHGRVSDTPGSVHKPGHDRWQLPEHLGYDSHESIGAAIEEPSYAVTKTHDVTYFEWYLEPQMAERIHYTGFDVTRLNNDSSADKIYSSDGYEVWLINNMIVNE